MPRLSGLRCLHLSFASSSPHQASLFSGYTGHSGTFPTQNRMKHEVLQFLSLYVYATIRSPVLKAGLWKEHGLQSNALTLDPGHDPNLPVKWLRLLHPALPVLAPHRDLGRFLVGQTKTVRIFKSPAAARLEMEHTINTQGRTAANRIPGRISCNMNFTVASHSRRNTSQDGFHPHSV